MKEEIRKKALYDERLTGNEFKLMMLLLDGNETKPVEWLMDKSQMSHKTYKNGIRHLKELGYLVDKKREDRYVINYDEPTLFDKPKPDTDSMLKQLVNDPKINSTAFKLMALIISLDRENEDKDGVHYVTDREWMMNKMNISTITMANAVKTLRECGYLKDGRMSYHYKINYEVFS